MTKIKYFFLIILGATAITLGSCKKDKGNSSEDKTALLTATVWKYDTAAIDFDNDGVMDTAIPEGIIEDCLKDNTIAFVSDGTGVADEGALKCTEYDPQATPFTWTFAPNSSSTIEFTGSLFAGIEGEAKLITLTSDVMELSTSYELVPGFSARIIIRMKH